MVKQRWDNEYLGRTKAAGVPLANRHICRASRMTTKSTYRKTSNPAISPPHSSERPMLSLNSFTVHTISFTYLNWQVDPPKLLTCNALVMG